MLGIHASSLITQPDVAFVCQVAVAIATIAKFISDYRRDGKRK